MKKSLILTKVLSQKIGFIRIFFRKQPKKYFFITFYLIKISVISQKHHNL